MGHRRSARIPREIFLSHSNRNQKFARRVADTLRDRAIPVWYSETHIVGAEQWHDEIGNALARCDWFLLVLSPQSVKSRWVKRELVHALNDDRYDNHIVPLLYRPCDVNQLSWTLPSIQAVDFTRDERGGFACLLRIWDLDTEEEST